MIQRRLPLKAWALVEQPNLGKKRYAQAAKRPLITADCGGSNGARVHLWKVELQKLADQTGPSITVEPITRPPVRLIRTRLTSPEGA